MLVEAVAEVMAPILLALVELAAAQMAAGQMLEPPILAAVAGVVLRLQTAAQAALALSSFVT
jgi:hypothetical protein